MDNFDKKILKVLQADSRFTYSQIAAMVGLEDKEVERRIKAMEREGVFGKYTAVVDT